MTASEAGKLGAIASKNITNWLKRQEKIVEYYLNPNKCLCCGRVIEYKNKSTKKFCSQHCAAIINNKLRYGTRTPINVDDNHTKFKHDRSRFKYYKNCLFCGKEISVKKKYCSLDCMIKYTNLQSDEEIRSNKVVTSNRLRNFLLKYNSKCMNPECGWNWKSERNPTLEIHHIDGNPNNNVLSNVILLCPNCHSLTDTYRAKNFGNGRAFRRKRYKEGKSY